MTSNAEVIAALPRWPIDQTPLLGVVESRTLEFKKTAYRLGDDRGKAEFAKDIAGMANAGGGLIVLGVETDRDPALGRDKSIRIRPLAAGSCNVQQMEDVARVWIYPPYRSMEVHEWPGPDGRLLVSLHVSGFSDMGGLAVVLGPGDPPDRRTIGVPVRSEARVDFHTAPEIYEWIRRGRFQGAIPTSTEESGSSRSEADTQLERIRTDFVDAGATGVALFWLQAWPQSPTRLEQIFDRDGVRGLFLDPPAHRSAGFNFWGLQPEVDSSGGIRVSAGQDIALWITPSAIATLVVGQEYVTWAMERYDQQRRGLLINPTAVGEFTYEFVRAYALVNVWFEPRVTRCTLRLGLLQAAEPQPLRLGEGLPQTFFGRTARPAPRNELQGEVGPVEVDESGVRRVTALLLRRFYELFGWGSEAIPHMTDAGESWDPGSPNRR